MEKAYDFKALGGYVANAAGLQLVEEQLEALGKAAWEGFKLWLNDSAVISVNKIDDVVAPFINNLDGIVYAGVEKLDINGDGV